MKFGLCSQFFSFDPVSALFICGDIKAEDAESDRIVVASLCSILGMIEPPSVSRSISANPKKPESTISNHGAPELIIPKSKLRSPSLNKTPLMSAFSSTLRNSAFESSLYSNLFLRTQVEDSIETKNPFLS